MSKRLPFPHCLADDPLSDPKPDAERTATLYLDWICARDGIKQPHKRDFGWGAEVNLSFYGDGAHYVVRTPERTERRGRRYVKVPASYETVLSVPLPPWALPTKRADLWHAAHQAGATPDACCDIANHSRWNKAEFALLLEAAVPVKTAARDKQATLEAQLAQPARMAQYLADRAQRDQERRERQERENREHEVRRYDAERLQLDHATADQWDEDSPATANLWRQELRNKWMRLAKAAREYQLGADEVAYCLGRAREFHRDYLQRVRQDRAA